MQLKTILNRVEPFKSFVYGKARWVEGETRPTLEVALHARKNGRAICAGCGRPGPGYDRLPARRFQFVPLWGMAVFFVYATCTTGSQKASSSPRGSRSRGFPWT